MDNKKKKIITLIGGVAVVAVLVGILTGIALSSFLKPEKEVIKEDKIAEGNIVAEEKDEADAVNDDEAIAEDALKEDSGDTTSVTKTDEKEETKTKDVTEKSSKDDNKNDKKSEDSLVAEKPGMPIEEAEKLIKPAEVKPEVEVKKGVAANEKYMIIMDDVSFTEAMDDCKERGGHLLTIEDYDEYAKVIKFIYDNTADNCIFYLGGMRDKKSKEYHWVDAKGNSSSSIVLNNVSSYSAGAWAENEPGFVDNHDNPELYMAMYYNSSEGRWVWCDVVNDLPGNANTYMGRTAYICEFE